MKILQVLWVGLEGFGVVADCLGVHTNPNVAVSTVGVALAAFSSQLDLLCEIVDGCLILLQSAINDGDVGIGQWVARIEF